MANAIYPKYKEFLLNLASAAESPISSPIYKAILVDTNDYSYSASHEFLTSITAGGRVATSPALGSLTATSGVFDAADTTFSAVSGDVSEAIVIVLMPTSGATDGNTRLVCYIDTGATGLPVTPNGGDINLAFDSGANKIFAL